MATNNSANQGFTNNSDGFDISGGTTARKLTVTAGDITMNGGGSNVYTMPAATGTLMSRDSTDTVTGKSIDASTNTLTNIPFSAFAAAALVTHRQGGSATNWSTAGTSNQTVGVTRTQVGALTTSTSAAVTLTFPVAFSQVPILIGTILSSSTFSTFHVETLSASSATISAFNNSGTRVAVTAQWMATGTV